MELLTSGQLSMFGPETSTDSSSAISSPALESGVMPSVSPDGQTISQHGRSHARANRSAPRAKRKGSRIDDTFSQSAFGSSESEDLSFALVKISLLGPRVVKWASWLTGKTKSTKSPGSLRHPKSCVLHWADQQRSSDSWRRGGLSCTYSRARGIQRGRTLSELPKSCFTLITRTWGSEFLPYGQLSTRSERFTINGSWEAGL